MDDPTRSDIRSLLKSFGIQADEAISDHLARNPGIGPLHVRIALTDLTDYGVSSPDQPLHLVLEGTIRQPLDELP